MAIEIQTTQNVILNFRTAGLGPRILARLLDGFFILLWVITCIFITNEIRYYDSYYVVWVIMLLPILFYDLLFEYFNNGQSMGKRILKIQVVNIDGTTPSVGSYLIRWLFRLVDFTLTTSVLAVLMVAFTEKSQRLGDYLAGTTVISLKDEKENENIILPDITVNENYEVIYSDILERLNDRDINTIQSILNDYRYYSDHYTQKTLADKIKSVTGYSTNLSDRDFLKKISDDYNYLSMQ